MGRGPKNDNNSKKQEVNSKRAYLKQSDVPGGSLDDALRVPQAIFEHYGGKPTSPLYVAKALNIDPRGSQFKLLTGAAIAFGLVDGGAQATSINVLDLARRIFKPKIEGDQLAAKRQAVMGPRIFKEFLTTYNENPLPRQDIALNVLEDMGVPMDKREEVFERILSSAKSVGFTEDIKGKTYIMLQGAVSSDNEADKSRKDNDTEEEHRGDDEGIGESRLEKTIKPQFQKQTQLATAIADDERRKKVFITHGKNQALIEPIKKLLEFGELMPIVSIQRQTVSKPIPEKVMDDMRMCGAAIIHVDAETVIIDGDGKEHVIINPNVLIEIGAAMAFYGRRFILLVKDGVKLPSNLQGLYEVKYSNDMLDATATIKLLEAIKDIKNYSLPTDIQDNDE